MRFLINSKRFNVAADILFKPFVALSFLFLFIGLVFAFFLSPDDYQQGSTVRIMYVHVPSAWLAMMTYLIMTIYSIIALAFRMPFGFIVNTAVAPIGAVFTLICIVSGSLWGKPMWGTWWVWDARLTSMLILCIFYFAYIGISNAFPRKIDGSKPAAIVAIVGMINLPIIKFSVDWWNTLHQPASIIRFDGPSINQEMLLPLVIMLLGILFMSIFIILINIKTNLIYKKYQSEIIKIG